MEVLMSITEPYAPVPDSEDLSAQARRTGWEKREELPAKKTLPYEILIVDDEDLITKLIGAMLKNEGHRYRTARNGMEALTVVKSTKFDAVITDIVMPGMDGITLTKEILRLHPDLPIMVMTGYSERYSPESAIVPGARDFIMKPFSIDEFMLRFKKMMRDQETLSAKKKGQSDGVGHLNTEFLEEINGLKKETESLKKRLTSLRFGLGL
jgi:DNA-binding NtrC family response regulator